MLKFLHKTEKNIISISVSKYFSDTRLDSCVFFFFSQRACALKFKNLGEHKKRENFKGAMKMYLLMCFFLIKGYEQTSTSKMI